MRLTLTGMGMVKEIPVTDATHLDIDMVTFAVRLDGVVLGTLTDTGRNFWHLALLQQPLGEVKR